jgi:hypothetical protein
MDLARAHPFAAERVGFAFGHLSVGGTDTRLIILKDYLRLADNRYIDDPRCGARIDSQAIRGAMQHSIDTSGGAFHVHLHDWPGRPRFSQLDWDELPRLIPSFQVVRPSGAHGLLLLSRDACVAEVWLPGIRDAVVARTINIVGFPFSSI